MHPLVNFASSPPPPIKGSLDKPDRSSLQSPQNKFVVAANFFRSPLFWRVRGPLAEFWAVTQCGSSVGGIALHHYRAHPRTECLYQDPLLRLQIYAQKRQRIYLEQKKPKKDGRAAITARSLLAQVFPSTFGFISGRSIPAAVWRGAHLLLQHAQAGFLLGHGPLGRQQEAGW